MINMSNCANIDMRLVPLKDSGIASTQEETLFSPTVESALDRIAGLRAQRARGAQECASERHDVSNYVYYTQTRSKEMNGVGTRWNARVGVKDIFFELPLSL